MAHEEEKQIAEPRIPYFEHEEGAQRYVWLKKNLKPVTETLRRDVEERISEMEADFDRLGKDEDVQAHVRLRREERRLDKRYE